MVCKPPSPLSMKKERRTRRLVLLGVCVALILGVAEIEITPSRALKHPHVAIIKGIKKTSFDINFISQTITANNLRLRLDDIQELLPSFFPVLVSVGSVSVEFSLSLSKPLKARINDVFILLRANPTSATEHSPEELREVLNSRVLTFSLLRGEIITDDNDNEGCSSTTTSSVHSSSSYFDIGLKPEAIDKLQELLQQSEIWIERLHIRVEDTGISAPPPLNLVGGPGKGFAAGFTIDSIKLQGDDFNSYTTFMDEVRRIGAPDPPSIPTSMMEGDQEELLGVDTTSPNQKHQAHHTCLRVCKVGVLKGIKLYCDSAASKSELFLRETDDNCVPSDSELQQLMGMIFYKSNTTLPVEQQRPILKIDTATFSTGLSLSRKVFGLITSAYVHSVFSPIQLNFSFTLLGRFLRWVALFNRHSESLIYAAACAKPAAGVDGRKRVACMWQYALRSVIRQIRKRRFHSRFHSTDDGLESTAPIGMANVGKTKLHDGIITTDLTSSRHYNTWKNNSSSTCQRRKRSSMKWSYWFKQWIDAARYIQIRDLLCGHTELEESVFDTTTTNTNGKRKERHHHSRYREILHAGNGQVSRARVLPWMIPKSDLNMSEALLKERVRSGHPLKPLPSSFFSPGILLALWSLQLDMEVWSPIQITSGALAIFKSRVTWLGKMRRREEVRNEKSHKLWRSSLIGTHLEERVENNYEKEKNGNTMVDRIGTLLLCPIQASGLKALAQQVPWKVAVTLTLEEANAATDEFEHATIDCGATYDSISKSVHWVNENGGEVLDFHVELGEEQARQLAASQRRKSISIYEKDETAAITRHVSSLSEGTVEKMSCKSVSSTASLSQGGGVGEPLDSDSFPSSFLLTVTVTAKSRILGNTVDLGSATLPGGILTAKRGKVCEHRCRLIGKRQAREGLAVLTDQVELILLSTFVPPGDSVVKEEKSLLLASRKSAGKWDISNSTKHEIFSDSNGSETRILDVSDLITDAAHGVKTVAQIAKECNAPLWLSVLPQELFVSSHISEVAASTSAVHDSSSVQMERINEDKNADYTSTNSCCCSTGVQKCRCQPSGVTLFEFNAKLIQGRVEMDLKEAAFGRFSLQINNIHILDYQAPADRQPLLHIGPLKTSIEVTAKTWYTPPGGYGFLYMNNWNSDNVITSITSCLGAYSINWSPQSIVSDCYKIWRSVGGGSGTEAVAQSCLVGSTGQTGDAWITVQGFDGREVSVSASFGKFNNIEVGAKHYLQSPSLENEELRQQIKELERQLMVMRAAAGASSNVIAAPATNTNDSKEGEE